MPVDSTHPDYDEMIDRWDRCRDVYNGQDAVHAAGEKYLPRLADQPNREYTAYKQRAIFYNATYRTISGLVGMMFRQPAKVEVPDQILRMFDNVTMSGVSLHVFGQNVASESLALGRVGVLVDYPPVAEDVRLTLADARQINLRPTMQLYRTESIINWRTETVNNIQVLTLVVLKERRSEKEDEFKDKWETVYRVLELIDGRYRVRIMRRILDKNDPKGGRDETIEEIYPLMRGRPLGYIPFVFVSADDLTANVDVPPFIDLVDLNLSHYRSTADLEHGAHFTGLPTPVVTGHKAEMDEHGARQQLYIGSMTAWIFPSADADAKFLEFTGAGLEALEKRLEMKEKQMAVLGARMLEPQKRQVETTETTSIHRKGEESLLANVAQVISDGMKVALQWFADWAGVSVEVLYEINKDFFPVRMAPEELTALVSSWQQGAISDDELFDNLQAGQIIGEDKTKEEHDTELGESKPKLINGLPADEVMEAEEEERKRREEERRAA